MELQERIIWRQPVTEWGIDLALVKLHARVQDDIEDKIIQHYLEAAVGYFEEHTDTTLPLAKYHLTSHRWPCGRVVLPRPPARQLVSIQYYDQDGALHDLPEEYYTVYCSGAWRGSIDFSGRPSDARDTDALQIEYRAGYGTIASSNDAGFPYTFPIYFIAPADEDLLPWPKTAVQAVLFGVQHLYELRDSVAVGTIASEIPHTMSSFMRLHHNYGI